MAEYSRQNKWFRECLPEDGCFQQRYYEDSQLNVGAIQIKTAKSIVEKSGRARVWCHMSSGWSGYDCISKECSLVKHSRRWKKQQKIEKVFFREEAERSVIRWGLIFGFKYLSV